LTETFDYQYKAILKKSNQIDFLLDFDATWKLIVIFFRSLQPQIDGPLTFEIGGKGHKSLEDGKSEKF